MYNESIVILVSDHGVSFRGGDHRRVVSDTDYEDVLSVPLFIKKPRQQDASVSDRNVEVIDIVPSLLELLGLESNCEMAGSSIFEGTRQARATKVLLDNTANAHDFPIQMLRRAGTIQRKEDPLGTSGFLAFGPYQEIHGRATSEYPQSQSPGPGVARDGEQEHEQVALTSKLLPCLVSGRLVSPAAATG